jgi:DNA replication licensing factor MCM2
MLPHDDDADVLDDDDMMRDVDDLDEDAEEAEGIDLFADDFENDYQARENDAYEGDGIDDEGDYDELDPASIAATRKLDAACPPPSCQTRTSRMAWLISWAAAA